ncbi:transposase [Flavicella sp.]|uniref:transposase n=1 Tax=Flavicella sp. TaxID=2957742 RepID=UPI00301A765B
MEDQAKQIPSTSRQNDERSNFRNNKKSMDIASILKIILCPSGEDSEDENEEDDDLALETATYSLQKLDNNFENEEAEHLIQNLVASSQVEIEDNSISDEEDVPLASLFPNCRERPEMQRTSRWRKSKFDQPEDTSWKDKQTFDDSWNNFTPLEFFLLIFDENTMKHIVEQTNIYALQSKGKELKLELVELKTYLGILMKFGIVHTPSYRYFWKNSSRYNQIADSMSRNRFEEIKSFLHFNNNALLKPRDHPEHDKLHKTRPVIEAIRNNCRKIPQEEHQAIDEQIIPTKAHSALKQYNPMKPHKWGYKVISRAGASGFIYDFLIYTGKGCIEDSENIGVSSAYVIKLSEDVPRNKNYKLFFDNWFSSLPLVEALNDRGILCLSTVRSNRLKGIKLKEEKYLKKEGRGSYDFSVEQNSQTIAIKWYDNKAVHLLSNYAGIEPTDVCKRWDRKRNQRIEVTRPLAVKEYNKFMGGVDLSDMLIELYRIDFKSKKWYMRIFFYLLDMSVVNAWLLYRRVLPVNRAKTLSLLEFKEDVASGLMASVRTKRGRPSESPEVKHQKKRVSCHPADSIRLDSISHWPEWIEHPQRCKKCVNAQSKIICSKCRVALCFTKNRNCYLDYHQK